MFIERYGSIESKLMKWQKLYAQLGAMQRENGILGNNSTVQLQNILQEKTDFILSLDVSYIEKPAEEF